MSKDYHPFNQSEYLRWVQSSGDNTLRLDYKLNENSIVLDLGGYKGEWSEKIYNKYGCNIYVFEPVLEFFNQISEKFKNNEKIKFFNFGLSNRNDNIEIYLLDDASSVFSESQNSEKIKLVDIVKELAELSITNIDLMKLNVEGEEYNILNHLISCNLTSNIKNIQVQFHRHVENCNEMRNKIREELSKTHKLTYDFEYIWENWEIK